jgi:peptide/nickel transport system substrate-binding protein
MSAERIGPERAFTLNRRRFVSTAAAGAAVAAIAPVAGLRLEAAALQETPRTGGTLRVVYGEEPKNLHTQIDSGTEGVYVQMQIFDSLLNLGPNGEFVPGLAVDMPEQPDETTFIFTLRQGVTFHNGKPFTADDVIWTFDRLLGKFPDLTSTQAARFSAQIASVEKLDDFTVQFSLVQPWADFFPLLAGDKYMRILQKDAEAENPDEFGISVVIGTGPFKLKEWIVGDHLTLERFDGYWGEPAYLDEIVYRSIPEESTRMNSFESGDIDVLLAPALKDLADLEQDADYKVLSADGGNMKRLAFNTTLAPFNDKRVRQAIAYAVDRQEIVDAIYYGYAAVGQGILPPWNAANDPNQTFYPYDPDKATQLLSEAGVGDLEFEIVTSDATEYVDLATLISAQLERVGVRASILPLDKTAFTDRTFTKDGTANPGFQAYAYRLIFGFPTTDYGWRTYHPDSALNAYGYCQPGGEQDDQVPGLLDQSTSTTDPEAQKQLYSQISELIMDDMPALTIAWQKNLLVTRANVMDLGITVIHNMPFKQVWLAE